MWSDAQILTGDCRTILPTLEPESVQCCVTSPPYWGLRDYGTASWEGGAAECDHRKVQDEAKATAKSTLNGGLSSTGHIQEGFKSICGHCGAHRIDSQLGLESTPEEYVTKMVAVFREVWRVLRDDGTLWLNMGDCYSSGNSGQNVRDSNGGFQTGLNSRNQPYTKANPGRPPVPGMKPKDLCGIPWRLAFALQADGWYLRSDIIWHKPNPMPESVTDRPTKSHEYIFLMTKQEKYFYDAEAIREENVKDDSCLIADIARQKRKRLERKAVLKGGLVNDTYDSWSGVAEFRPGRNKRSVWTTATQPYAEAHFATFPEELPKICILAGSRLGDTILDPFAGSGTTGKVAIELGRLAILIELNPDYITLANHRTFVTPGFL